MPTFRRRARPRCWETASPSSSTAPPLMGISRLMARSKVDFPEPEGPITEMNSPSPTVKLTPFRACTPLGYCLDTLSKRNSASMVVPPYTVLKSR